MHYGEWSRRQVSKENGFFVLKLTWSRMAATLGHCGQGPFRITDDWTHQDILNLPRPTTNISFWPNVMSGQFCTLAILLFICICAESSQSLPQPTLFFFLKRACLKRIGLSGLLTFISSIIPLSFLSFEPVSLAMGFSKENYFNH